MKITKKQLRKLVEQAGNYGSSGPAADRDELVVSMNDLWGQLETFIDGQHEAGFGEDAEVLEEFMTALHHATQALIDMQY
jgi:hypothetical protein